MKAFIEREDCISCGLCVSICPEVFRMADDDLAEVYVDEVPDGCEDAVQEACDSCPVSIISAE